MPNIGGQGGILDSIGLGLQAINSDPDIQARGAAGVEGVQALNQKSADAARNVKLKIAEGLIAKLGSGKLQEAEAAPVMDTLQKILASEGQQVDAKSFYVAPKSSLKFSGGSVVRVDPTGTKVETVYTAPGKLSEAERAINALPAGAEQDAARANRLKVLTTQSSGSSEFERSLALETDPVKKQALLEARRTVLTTVGTVQRRRYENVANPDTGEIRMADINDDVVMQDLAAKGFKRSGAITGTERVDAINKLDAKQINDEFEMAKEGARKSNDPSSWAAAASNKIKMDFKNKELTPTGYDRRNTEIQTAIGNANAFRAQADEISKTLQSNPDILTTPAKFEGWLNTVGVNAKATLELMVGNQQLDIPPEVLKVENYQTLRNIAGKRATQATAMLNLAAVYAASKLGTGQSMSNRDIERALSIMGGDSPDPTVVIGQIQKVYSNMLSDATQKFKAMAGESSIDTTPIGSVGNSGLTPAELRHMADLKERKGR